MTGRLNCCCFLENPTCSAGDLDACSNCEHTTPDDASKDEGNTEENIRRRRQPEREPVQRRMTVRRLAGHLCEVAIRRVDPHIACTNLARSRVSTLLSRDYNNCDSTTIRLRYDYTTTHSTTTDVIEIIYDSTAIRVRQDYDEKLTLFLLLPSNRVEWKQARAIRRSRIVVVS